MAMIQSCKSHLWLGDTNISVYANLFHIGLQEGELWIPNNTIPVPASDIIVCIGDEDPSCLERQVNCFRSPLTLRYSISSMLMIIYYTSATSLQLAEEYK